MIGFRAWWAKGFGRESGFLRLRVSGFWLLGLGIPDKKLVQDLRCRLEGLGLEPAQEGPKYEP